MDYEIKDNVLVKYDGKDKKISLPENILVLGKGCFEGQDIEVVNCPMGLREVEDNAFKNCENLNTVIFKQGLEKIGEDVFMNCFNLERVDIPSSVMSIGEEAFSGCEETVIYSEARSYVDEYAAEKELGFDPGDTY